MAHPLFFNDSETGVSLTPNSPHETILGKDDPNWEDNLQGMLGFLPYFDLYFINFPFLCFASF